MRNRVDRSSGHALRLAEAPLVLGRWVNRSRLTVYPLVFFAGLTISWLVLVAGGNGILDANGEPIGADFLTFYSASTPLRDQGARAVYDVDVLRTREAQIAKSDELQTEWRYPPAVLFLIKPLAWLPYGAALAVWTVAGGLAMLAAIRRISRDYLALVLIAASPAFYRSFSQGQNGFFTTALLGFGLTLLRTRPVAAGLILGLLTYKPQFAVLVLAALAINRDRSAFYGYLASAAAVALVALVVFGVGSYQQFFASVGTTADTLFQMHQDLRKVHSFSSTMLLLGVSATATQCLQLLMSLAIACTSLWVWKQSRLDRVRFAALVLGTIGVSPYFFDYDLVILALPVLWLALDCMERGWQRGDLELLVLAWWAPFLATAVVLATSFMLTPVIVMLLLLMGIRRMRFEPAGDRTTRWPVLLAA
ncbi:MAG: glycosyltransferase family 87 protein [Dehalococcoidia bacterium]